jgi:hypothetical protein
MSDGNSLIISTEDDRVIRVHHLKPIPSIFDRGCEIYHCRDLAYTLRRGCTSAVIDSVDVSEDGRQEVVGTRKHTVHNFPANCYGGNLTTRIISVGGFRIPSNSKAA